MYLLVEDIAYLLNMALVKTCFQCWSCLTYYGNAQYTSYACSCCERVDHGSYTSFNPKHGSDRKRRTLGLWYTAVIQTVGIALGNVNDDRTLYASTRVAVQSCAQIKACKGICAHVQHRLNHLQSKKTLLPSSVRKAVIS